MITFLPKSKKGFSLIELLVTISIIAILGTIGISVYSAAQQSARDGKRKSDINQIAKAIETGNDPTARVYKYLSTDRDNDFPRGFPGDPTAGNLYCIAVSTSSYTPPTTITGTTTWTTSCPASTTVLNTSITTNETGKLGFTTPDIKSWQICASLERASGSYCLTSTFK